MTTPTITLYPDTLPAKEQANATFDTNVDNFMDWLTLTNGPELQAFVTYAQDVADNVLATALAGDLPPLTGKAGDYIRANAAENGGEFRTPQELAGDLSAFLASHKPVNVSGVTPSLDVATYNFFDQGALTADTTVSFASFPTNAKWQYSYVAAFDPSTTFDLSSASYASKSFSVASQDSGPSGVAFNTDGTSMFISGTGNDTVYQYTLSTGFDVSTASYASKSFSVASQDSAPVDLAFNTNGTSMFIVGSATDRVYQYTLSVGFDVSTASYASKSFNVSSQEPSPQALAFNTNGTSMFIVGFTNDTVYQYTLSTGFDVSTASYASKSFSVSSQDTVPTAIAFNTDGSSMLIVGDTNDTVFQYTLAPEYSLTLPTVVGTPSATATGDRVTYTFVTKDSGTTVNLIAEDII